MGHFYLFENGQVRCVGFPMGGSTVCVTEGVVPVAGIGEINDTLDG